MRSLRQGLLVALVATLGALAFAAPSAHAAFEIASFEAEVLEEDGDTYFHDAGAHPFLGVTAFRFNATGDNARNIRVDVPAGLMSNPEALPKCTDAQLASPQGCPPSTQLGTEEITVGLPAVGEVVIKVPLYNMTYDQTQVARFAFDPGRVGPLPPLLNPILNLEPVEIIGGVRWQTDYGLFFTISDAPNSLPVVASKLTFWGTPASSDHTLERGQACVTAQILPVPLCIGGGQSSTATPVPFLTTPTLCSGVKLETRLTVDSYAGVHDTASTFTPTGSEGQEGPQHCEDLPFVPSLSLQPGTTARDAPSGIDVNLHVPPDGLLDPNALASSHVRHVTVTLPPGMTMNPSAANGLVACGDEQLAQGTSAPVTCPAASRLGTVTVSTPLLADPLVGSIYLGRPLPGDRYRLFLTADGHGVSVRLKGSVRPNPQTGQVTAVFANNPQVPFRDFTLRFRGGPRAAVATPLDCGPAVTTSVFTPYAGGPPAGPTSAFTVGGGCGPAPFGPALGAGLDSPLAGASAPFTATIGRSDGHQYLSGVSVELPPGLIGMISRVAQCPDAQAAVGACPEASRVGTASVRAGAGPEPFALSGPVYFTGPYKGAPFGLVVVIRALAGPFDLGTVVVRQAIHVDRVDAHLSVVSDPLPTILEGIPLRLRSIGIRIDRPGFMRSPTACGPKQVTGRFGSTAGASAAAAASFSIEACERLRLRPKLKLRAIGRRQTRDGGHPGLRARLRQRAGQANLKRVAVKLPLTLALDPANARALCKFEDGLAGDCPRRSIIGRARAVSPALNRALRGPVHFVQGVRFDPRTGARIRTLPTLFVPLRGEVAIDLRATTAVRRGRLVNTFQSVPDAPVSRFDLRLKGGKGGILVVTRKRNLCRGKQVARVGFSGHNGKRAKAKVRMGTPCKSRKKRGRRKGERRKRERGAAPREHPRAPR